MKELIAPLKAEGYSGGIRVDEPMSRHCSLRVGGKASLYAEPGRMEDLTVLLKVLKEADQPWMVIGGGTNVFFPGGGYRGCVVRLSGSFRDFEFHEDGTVKSGAAAATPAVFSRAVNNGLTGLESVAGIPGTLGGAVKMNAGTMGGSLSEVVHRVQILADGKVNWVGRDRLDFAYRRLNLPPGSVITRVELKLAEDDSQAVLARVNRVMEGRKATQPLGLPSAGCWFLNPHGENAGRLIDEAGLKGMRIGGAEVSSVHANFLVNTGDAVPSDFTELADIVRTTVKEKFGIVLEEEVQVVEG